MVDDHVSFLHMDSTVHWHTHGYNHIIMLIEYLNVGKPLDVPCNFNKNI